MLVPVAQHQTRFVLPGLRVDARGVAAGRTAVVLLPSLDRVVGALRTMTAEVDLEDLYRDLEIHRVRAGLGAIEFLMRFPAGDVHLLDRLAKVAGLYGGELLTGETRHFVRYRDRESPLGYDVDRLAEGEADLMLYGRVAEGPYRIDETITLRSLILRLPPEARRGGAQAAPELLLWVAPGLRPALESSLFRSEVEAEVARVTADDGLDAYLYRIATPHERIVRLLHRTPGIEVFVPAGERAAVELGFEHPFDLGASAVALGEGHFYLFRGNVAGARILEESLVWLPLRQVCQPAVAGVTLPARPAEAGPATSVPVRLVPARRRSGRPEALLVPPSQTEALRRLLYLLPTAVLERHRALSLRRGVLLVGEGQVEAIPLGVPLRRYGEAVYLPLGWTLLPALPPALVAEAVGATPGRLYVFPGPEEPPFFVEEAQLEPLSRAFLGRLEAVAVAAAPLPPEPGRARLVYEKLGPFPLWGEGFHPLPTGGEER